MKSHRNIAVAMIVGFAITTAWIAPSPLQARELEDLNLTERIILVLANSLSPDYQSGPEDMPGLMQMVEDGDIFVDEEEEEAGQGKGMYAYSYPLKIGDFRGSGYFRIASQARYRKPEEEEGWRSLGEDGGTGADVWFRTVRTGAVSYNEIQASLSKGNFVLTTSMRRPAGESASQSQEIILERFNVLLENARRYGILANIAIMLVGEDEEEDQEPLEENALLNIPGRDSQESAIRFRIHATDHKGTPLTNVNYYTIELKGFLASYARLQGAAYNEKKERYEIHDPPVSGAVVDVAFPALKNGAFAQALEQDATMSEGFGIVLEVDAEFKPERRPSE